MEVRASVVRFASSPLLRSRDTFKVKKWQLKLSLEWKKLNWPDHGGQTRGSKHHSGAENQAKLLDLEPSTPTKPMSGTNSRSKLSTF